MVYPVASSGKRQSPIDIETGKAQLNPCLKPIKVKYGAGCCKTVVNTGDSFRVDVDDTNTCFTGGALGDGSVFKLVQFHAHWGTAAGAKGSEHTVNGKLYPAELHLVHWNTKYGNVGEALTKPDGLAVIGIFLDIGDEDHPEVEKVIKGFGDIRFRNMTHNYQVEIDPTKFLPDDMSFWHYEGSLTTPPLFESVLWHVLRTPIAVSKRQLDAMASLRIGSCQEKDPSCIVNNFRPPVPVGENRAVSLFTGEANNEVEALKKEVKELKDAIAGLKVDFGRNVGRN